MRRGLKSSGWGSSDTMENKINDLKRLDVVATAMAAKRAELINQPLARIWKELAAVAIATAEAS